MDKDETVSPISNIDWVGHEFPDAPRDFEIIRLQREIAGLRTDKKNLVVKLSLALRTIQEELNFWQLLIFENHKRTMGETHARITELKLIVNKLIGEVGPYSIMDELTKMHNKGKR
jgi:hypothetical protein